MTLALSRSLPLAAAGLALAAAGCKTTPCHPPACLAEAPLVSNAVPPPAACTPPPSACAPTSAPVMRSAPYGTSTMPSSRAVAAAPAVDPDAQARLDVIRTSLEAAQRRNAEIEAKIAAVEAGRGGGFSAAKGTAMPAGPAEASARRIAEELKSVPGTQVLVEGGSAVAVVTDSFAPGSDKLKTSPDVHAALRAISAAVARHPDARVTVTGHTDSTPIKASKWADNEALSKARAEVVARALTTEGVTRDRMAVSGVGPKNPMVAPEKTAADRARNRRVEVEFAFGR